MYLRKLTIAGFKSFVEKIEIEFDQGITSIIGPNGCGKSNVSDAIRWVLGEQNPRRLRGNTMQDMIFNGTANRPASGMAEVSVLFDNSDGNLPISYREVEVTRRLYRSGESDYFINQTRCRLKDITDLFLDSGIGTSCYSIMEQGRVDMIVNARPVERREIIEEAAGISRFLHRQLEALRKLERTDQDLTRLEDILGELQRRRRSLERQARQAQLAKKYRHELREAEYVLHFRAGKKLWEQLENLASKWKGLSTQVQLKAGELAAVRERKNELNVRLQHQEEISRQHRDAYASASARLEQMDQHLQHLVTREKEYVQLKTRLESEVEADTRRSEEEHRRIGQAQEQAAGLEKQIETLQETIQTLQGELDEVNRQFEIFAGQGAEQQKNFLNLEQRITEWTNQRRLWERGLWPPGSGYRTPSSNPSRLACKPRSDSNRE